MDLLTVTCRRDMLQMCLQAESIQKFLEPCLHWIIINEPDAEDCLSEWHDLLLPYYTKHSLKLIPKPLVDKDIMNETGWNSQQYYKFYAYKLIQDDYLTLDSKNFFIRNSNINEWNDIVGNGVIDLYSNNRHWDWSIKNYSEYFKIPYDFNHLSILTPFVFKKDILDQIEDFDEFLEGFKNINVIRSEFLMYSSFLKKIGKFPEIKKLPHETARLRKFNTMTEDFGFEMNDYIKYMFGNDNIKVAGFHRHLLSIISDSDKDKILAWLKSIGLQNSPFE